MIRICCSVAITLLFACCAMGAGEESVGNEKLSAPNYKDWPKVMPVINDGHRLYRSWVNGNERFYFAGSTESLNTALKNFAKIEADRRVVVLRPGPASTTSFSGDHIFEYNWELHLLGGIAKHMATRDLGANIWDPNPYLHVYVGGDIQLNKIEIPKGVDVLEIADLQSRYAVSFASRDQSVRGWACGELAALNVFDANSMKRIAEQLQDPETWVQQNAAGALAKFTHSATDAMKKLEAVQTDDERLKERIAQSIDTLKTTNPDPAQRTAYLESLQSIHKFVVGLPK